MGETVKRDKPAIITQQPFSKDIAVNGLSFIEKQLGLGSTISPEHPLHRLYLEATKHLSSGTTWGPCREFNLLALWGIRLSMVQHWAGFKRLTERIRKDLPTWDSHLHEAMVASMFWLAGCEGEFINPGKQGGPDLKIIYDGHEALVECRRSRFLTQQEQTNWDIWSPICSEMVHYLKEHVPSALVRFYYTRNAISEDRVLLLDGLKQKIASWEDYLTKNPLARWGHGDLRASDSSFTGLVLVADDPDKLFDTAAEGHPGFEVPHETEAVSLILDLTLSDPPVCDGLWYAKIHAKRDWAMVEDKVLSHLKEKTRQLNWHRKSSPTLMNYPSIVWIEHPAIVEATGSELNHLGQRISEQFANDDEGHFAVVAAVVLTCSRSLLSKAGNLIPQFRLNFVSNPSTHPAIHETFPYVTWSWFDGIESNGTLAREVMSKRMWLGIKSTDPDV
jgi:hypothetical protein